MRVDAEKCTGCGACVDVCSTGAITLSAGLAILDQATCTECQACVDACPVGAITTLELPVALTEPAAVQPISESEIVVAVPAPSSPKPWLSAALAFAGREILPRLADALITALDRRLAQAQPANSQCYLPSRKAELSSTQNEGRGYCRRSRYGQALRRGRGQGHGTGKGNWL
jgi:Fe-S-cluster-containing hydrogenase component 2